METMPLVRALRDVATSRQSWHMPGHHQGTGFCDSFRRDCLSFDQTELPVTDDLNHPTGPAKEAMELAAQAFGAGRTFFITGGSTTAIGVLLSAAVQAGGELVLSRTCHQSVLHAAAFLDLKLSFIEESQIAISHDDFSLMPQIGPAAIDAALQGKPPGTAVWLTSPDYYGVCLDLAAIANVTGKHGAKLLVDEAHGAHFAFAPQRMPAGALQCGADACVQSGHKTLPVLTPGAYLHVSPSQRETLGSRIEAHVPLWQTSSPSFLLAASLDYARALMQAEGEKRIEEQCQLRQRWTQDFTKEGRLPPLHPSQDPFRRDPMRLVIRMSEGSGLDAMRARDRLARTGIDIEFCDPIRLVLIISLFHTQAQWQQLQRALQQCFLAPGGSSCGDIKGIERKWQRTLSSVPERAISLRDALLKPQETVHIRCEEAAGKVVASAITPYPPGVPILWPGEVFTVDHLDLIRELRDNEIHVNGIDEEMLRVIKV